MAVSAQGLPSTQCEALGGVLYRTPESTVRHTQGSRADACARAELDHLRTEHAQAGANRKEELQAQIDQTSRLAATP